MFPFPFQSLVTPNGLIAHMFGPLEGRHHDAFMLAESGLLTKLQRFQTPSGEPYIIYGDPTYGVSQHILAPFQGARLSPQQQEFNRAISKVCVSVKWAFGKVVLNFAYMDFKKNQKVLLQPVGKYYLVAVLLTAIHACMVR